jgi:hypothetical protein
MSRARLRTANLSEQVPESSYGKCSAGIKEIQPVPKDRLNRELNASFVEKEAVKRSIWDQENRNCRDCAE